MSILATLAPALIQLAAGKISANKMQKDADAQKTAAESELAGLSDKIPSFGPSDHMRRYLRTAQEMDKQQNTRVEEQAGRAISDAMRYGGRNAQANVTDLLSQLNQMPTASNTMQAEKDYALADQAAINANTQFQQQRLLGQEDYLRQLASGAATTQQQLGLQGSQATADVLSSLAGNEELYKLFARNGGMLEAGDGMTTPGKFSHKNNEMYLVDKKGNVRGAVTGDEDLTVLNNEQRRKVSKESPFYRSLMKKFNKRNKRQRRNG